VGILAPQKQAGNGEYLPLVGNFMSFNEIVDTLKRQGNKFSFKEVPMEVFATSFPGAAEAEETFAYFQTYMYLGTDSDEQIALANMVAGRKPTNFATWARENFPMKTGNGTPKAGSG
jgi:hypothetical protein